MSAASNPATLVTGATGFIGRHVARRLLVDRRRVVVLARSRAGVSAGERIGRIFGNLCGTLELLEGDLAHSWIIKENLSRLRSRIHTVIHCAGDTCFSAGENDSIRAVQMDGPLNLLKTLAASDLRRWCHVSTAFVCGKRSGMILESETDVGQEFHNSYERLKLQSEVAFKEACRELQIDLQILRPGIVVGRAPATPGGAPSNVLVAFFRILAGAGLIVNDTDRLVRIHGAPSARFNIVPVEYVASAIARLADAPAAAGGTFHLVAANPPTQKILAGILSQRFGLRGLRILEAGEELSDPSPLESKLKRMLRPYKDYLEQDVQFDFSITGKLLERHGVHIPRIDRKQINRLIDLGTAPHRSRPALRNGHLHHLFKAKSSVSG